MFFLKELENLLPCVNEIETCKVFSHFLEAGSRSVQILVSLAALNHLDHSVDVGQGNVKQLLGLAAGLHLALESHKHQIKQFLHTCGVQFHDRAVGQLLKDLLGTCHGVHGLTPEKLLHELGGKHALDDVLEYLLGAVLADVLRAESLLKDVNHLTAKVDDDKR